MPWVRGRQTGAFRPARRSGGRGAFRDFDIPPENLVTQGYGEDQLKLETEAAERQNRRVAVRRITPLLQGVAQQQ
jgi:hypothetical protein